MDHATWGGKLDELFRLKLAFIEHRADVVGTPVRERPFEALRIPVRGHRGGGDLAEKVLDLYEIPLHPFLARGTRGALSAVPRRGMCRRLRPGRARTGGGARADVLVELHDFHDDNAMENVLLARALWAGSARSALEAQRELHAHVIAYPRGVAPLALADAEVEPLECGATFEPRGLTVAVENKGDGYVARDVAHGELSAAAEGAVGVSREPSRDIVSRGPAPGREDVGAPDDVVALAIA